MSLAIPTTLDGLDTGDWETFKPYTDALIERAVNGGNQREWLEEWSLLSRLIGEAMAVTYIQRSLDTADEAREKAFMTMISKVQPHAARADQSLKEKLLTLTVTDDDMQVMMRNLRDEVDLFREENIALSTEVQKLSAEYDNITGALSAEWDGESKNINQIGALMDTKDRDQRERAWHAMMGMWQEARPALNELFLKMLPLRAKMAKNADEPDYRAYSFRSKKRFDYTPADCLEFHEAIEKAVVPAATRIIERKRQRMGADVMKPWDWVVDMGKVVDARDAAPLKPFTDQASLIAHSQQMYDALDPQIGDYFKTMVEADVLDLDTRAGKSLGAYCYPLELRKIPFIFMNSTGSARDVQTMLHECGHAFHGFEAMNGLPLIWQQDAPMEFNEVASMAMELLAAPYLTKDKGGFYDSAEAARHRIGHLEKNILFWPYMAVVDGFQHWLYTHVDDITSTDQLDVKWDELWQRFLPGVDWTGFEDVRMSGWHRKLHIFHLPFYYIEYGMAQVGSMQIWRNSLADHAKALADYRNALSLGGTVTLPQLYEASGAEFRFDTAMLTDLVNLAEDTMAELEAELS